MKSAEDPLVASGEASLGVLLVMGGVPDIDIAVVVVTATDGDEASMTRQNGAVKNDDQSNLL